MEDLELGITATALGWAGVALSAKGVRFATLFHHSREAAEGELRSCGAALPEGPASPAMADALARLQRYASGESTALEGFPLDPRGPEFSRRAWLALRQIPAGETRSYGWLAGVLGSPKAARAAGAAMGANPIPLWLPCHRVVAADGSLHAFGGGLAMKRQLLEHEGALAS